MKQFFKMFFASMLAMIVTGVIIVGVVIGLVVGAVSKATSPKKETTSIADNSVLLIELGNELHEQGESNSIALFDNGSSYTAGLYDAIKAIEYAKTDDKIKGILIKLESPQSGWATMQQLRMAIKDFKSVNKFVYAYGEDISQGAYYIASAADSVYLNPVGGMELKGFASQLAFFKGTLDKLEIQPEIFYAGKFKSATEPFRADKMSDPNRQQLAALQADFWKMYLAAVAEHTNASDTTIHNWANTGAVQFPEDALQLKLVDGLLYWDEVEQRIRAKADIKEKDDVKYVKLDEYADNVKKNDGSGDERIAVLFAEGGIVDGEGNEDREIASEDMVKHIRKLAKNDKVKAVVLRVNSPGGSALASEVILRELELLHKKKPLVVSMGDYAASGGYYIACQADSIFAMPSTVTGSIGVFGVMFNASQMLKSKLGVTIDVEKNAKYADFPTALRPLNADEMQRMQSSVDKIYTIFKSRVAKGRKMDIALVDSIAQGRVWTGNAALKNGLVDGLGGLDRAIESAASLAKLKDYRVITAPAPSDKFEKMMQRMGKYSSKVVVEQAIQQETGVGYDYYKQLKKIYGMNGKALMAMPFQLTVQ